MPKRTHNKFKIKDLKEKISEKDEYIEHLERLAEAYNNLAELFKQELLDADRTLKAQEIIQNMKKI